MELIHLEIRHQLYKLELGLSLLIVSRYENEVKQIVCLSNGGVCGVCDVCVCVCVMGKRQIDATLENNTPFTLLSCVSPTAFIMLCTYKFSAGATSSNFR